LVALGNLIVERVLRQRVSCVLLFLLASFVEVFTPFVLFVAQEGLVAVPAVEWSVF
jgi:hypothetical protein